MNIFPENIFRINVKMFTKKHVFQYTQKYLLINPDHSETYLLKGKPIVKIN